jgi:hypothetical protein
VLQAQLTLSSFIIELRNRVPQRARHALAFSGTTIASDCVSVKVSVRGLLIGTLLVIYADPLHVAVIVRPELDAACSNHDAGVTS